MISFLSVEQRIFTEVDPHTKFQTTFSYADVRYKSLVDETPDKHCL